MIRLEKWRFMWVLGAMLVPWAHLDAQGAGSTAWVNEVKQVVAAQAAGEAALSSATMHSRFTQWSVELDSLPLGWPGFRFFRARLWSSSHRHPYLLVYDGSRIYRLGGFTGPEVIALTQRSPVTTATNAAALSRAKDIARLLDQNGAVDIVFPWDSQQSSDANSLAARWRHAIPETWPRDTVVQAEGGRTRVIALTVLSKVTWGMADAWLPVAYSVVLDEQGLLKAWARREGSPVQ
jgi:hypothetical protein